MISYEDSLKLKPGDRVIVDPLEDILSNMEIAKFCRTERYIYSPAVFILGSPSNEGMERFCNSICTIKYIGQSFTEKEVMFSFEEVLDGAVFFDRYMVSLFDETLSECSQKEIDLIFQDIINGGPKNGNEQRRS